MAVRKARMEFVSSREELGRLFARLGQELAEGSLTIGMTPVQIVGFESFKVSLKEDQDGLKVKVAVKLPKRPAVEGEAVAAVADAGPDAVEAEAAALAESRAAAPAGAEVPPEPVEAQAPEAAAPEAPVEPAPEPPAEPAPAKPARAKPRAAAKAPAKTPARKTGRPGYKTLKKRMRKPWKDLLTALAAGQLPEPQAVEAFLAECELMLSYPGKGDAHYDAFRVPMGQLRTSLAAGDQAGAAAAAAEMERLKKECHGRYK